MTHHHRCVVSPVIGRDSDSVDVLEVIPTAVTHSRPEHMTSTVRHARCMGRVCATHPAAAQGVILLAYLLNQGLKKRTFYEEHTEEKYQHTLAERGYDRGGGVVVDAREPAGPGGGVQRHCGACPGWHQRARRGHVWQQCSARWGGGSVGVMPRGNAACSRCLKQQCCGAVECMSC